MVKVVIWGASGHATVIADILRSTKNYDIVGFLDDTCPARKSEAFCGAFVLGGIEEFGALRASGVDHAIIGFGACAARLDAAARMSAAGFAFVTAVHPGATIARSVVVGEGSAIMAGAVVNPGVNIGVHVVINTSASVDHDCRIGDGAHICPGVRLAGDVSVGRAAWVGIGTVVLEHRSIADAAVVGAGSLVTRNVPPRVLAYGSPARVVRKVEPPVKKSFEDLAIAGGRPSFVEKLHVGRPNLGDRSAFLARVNAILDSRWLTNNGATVQEFESRLTTVTGARHCVAVCNATLGLEIVARACGLTGEVIVPAFTFVATAHALEWVGLTPVFCDIDPATHNLDPEAVERLITSDTSAIVGVHVWGRPCAVGRLTDIARRHRLKLLFDAAHALGCTAGGQAIGGFGDAEVFSFHATKFVNAFEGGAIATNDDDLASRIRLMSNFGFAGIDRVVSIGTNAKMTEISAAMGLTSLEALDQIIDTNRRHYETYRRELADCSGLSVIEYDPSERSNYQYVIVEVHPSAALSRDELRDVLWSENVFARRYFYPGCHRIEPYVSRLDSVSLGNTDSLCERVLSLPTGTAVTESDVRLVCDIMRTALGAAEGVRRSLSRRTLATSLT